MNDTPRFQGRLGQQGLAPNLRDCQLTAGRIDQRKPNLCFQCWFLESDANE